MGATFSVDRAHEQLATAIEKKGVFEVRKAARILKRSDALNEIHEDHERWGHLHKIVLKSKTDKLAVGKARELVREGADINMADLLEVEGQDKDGIDSPLTLAIGMLDHEMIKILLGGGQTPQKVGDGPHPLCRAIDTGEIEIVEMLLNADADVSDDDYSCFGQAVGANRADMVTKLFQALKNKVDEEEACEDAANACMEDGDRSCLHGAVEHCNEEIVKILLENNADVDCLDSQGRTPLSYLALGDGPVRDTVAIAELLIKANADPHYQDLRGWTPTLYAARRAEKDICLYFHSLQERRGELQIMDDFRVAQDRGTEIPEDDEIVVDTFPYDELERNDPLKTSVDDLLYDIKADLGRCSKSAKKKAMEEERKRKQSMAGGPRAPPPKPAAGS